MALPVFDMRELGAWDPTIEADESSEIDPTMSDDEPWWRSGATRPDAPNGLDR